VRRTSSLQVPTALGDLKMWLERAERIRTQQRNDKNKLYALHAPEVECIGKGKARKPYEFGVKVSLAVTHKQGLMVGARAFPGNPFDGHTLLAQQLEQTTTCCKTWDASPRRPSSTWVTGAWTPTTRAWRSSTEASSSR
jgi:IS5 family transposase